jgi:hypothetical protein
MLVGLMVIAGAVLCAALASYVMWWSTSRSGLWSLAAGAVLGIVAFICAIVIGWLITRAAFSN